MTRNIPQSREWRVRGYRNGREIYCHNVRTINKRFARWIARDEIGWSRFSAADRVTVAPAPNPRRCKNCGAFLQRGRCLARNAHTTTRGDANIWRGILGRSN